MCAAAERGNMWSRKEVEEKQKERCYIRKNSVTNHCQAYGSKPDQN